MWTRKESISLLDLGNHLQKCKFSQNERLWGKWKITIKIIHLISIILPAMWIEKYFRWFLKYAKFKVCCIENHLYFIWLISTQTRHMFNQSIRSCLTIETEHGFLFVYWMVPLWIPRILLNKNGAFIECVCVIVYPNIPNNCQIFLKLKSKTKIQFVYFPFHEFTCLNLNMLIFFACVCHFDFVSDCILINVFCLHLNFINCVCLWTTKIGI